MNELWYRSKTLMNVPHWEKLQTKPQYNDGDVYMLPNSWSNSIQIYVNTYKVIYTSQKLGEWTDKVSEAKCTTVQKLT